MEKIQITLANSETLKIIVNSKEKKRFKTRKTKKSGGKESEKTSTDDENLSNTESTSEVEKDGDEYIEKQNQSQESEKELPPVEIDPSTADLANDLPDEILNNYVPKNRLSDTTFNKTVIMHISSFFFF